MTLSDALGRTPTTLEEYVLAQVMFDYVKHNLADDPVSAAECHIDAMTNTELLSALSLGLQELLESQA